MIARILVGLGGHTSSTSSAIRYAVDLAQGHRAEVIGATVFDRSRCAASIGNSDNAFGALREFDRLEAMMKRQEKAVLEFEEICDSSGINYSVARESGKPYERAVSESRLCDLTVFGLESLLEHEGMGTYDGMAKNPSAVLAKLLTQGVCPVLGVSKEFHPIRRILVVYDGSPASANALKRFLQLQLWPNLTIKVITLEHAPEVARYCQAFGYDAEVDHVARPAKELLLEQATDWNADAIVIGNSVKRLWLKKLFGDTVMHVIQHTTVPLFLST